MAEVDITGSVDQYAPVVLKGQVQPLAATPASQRVTNEDWYGEVTPRLVLSHQSGLPNWAGDARDPERTDPLEFKREPGTGYDYSGEAYELLHAHVTQAPT